MSAARIAIEWHGGWLTAVAIATEKGRPSLGPGICVRVPENVDASDASQVGRWFAEQLRQADIAGRSVVWVAGRGDVLLKRLSLPRPPSENQLPAMVKLQMSRAMPMQGADAASDYAILGEQNGTLDLLGASAPSARLAWLRSMLAAAKLKLGSVMLRAQCSACIAGLPDAGQARIVISPGASSVEVVVVEPGGVVTSRGSDATWPSGDQEGFVRRIAVEVKRTWMGYRVAQHSLPVQSAVVIGGDTLCTAIAEAVGNAIEVESSALSATSIAAPSSVGSAEPTRCLALAGVGMPSCDRIDLLSPRKAVATRSKTRERALLGVMALVAIAGVAGVFGFIALGDLTDEQALLRSQNQRLNEQYQDFLPKYARLEHLRALAQSRPEWSAHVERVLSQASVEGVRIDQLGGVSRSGVWFGDPQQNSRYNFWDGEYRPAVRGAISLQGVGATRELSGMVRGRLVNDPIYVVQTQGPDAGLGFKLDIETNRRTIPVAKTTEPAAKDGAPAAEPDTSDGGDA
ncbi:MAG: hypothetical protein ACFCBV_02685 [Phycisphaerales bacterium]